MTNRCQNIRSPAAHAREYSLLIMVPCLWSLPVGLNATLETADGMCELAFRGLAARISTHPHCASLLPSICTHPWMFITDTATWISHCQLPSAFCPKIPTWHHARLSAMQGAHYLRWSGLHFFPSHPPATFVRSPNLLFHRAAVGSWSLSSRIWLLPLP